MTAKFPDELQRVLARNIPSGIAYGDATFPKETAFSGSDKSFRHNPKASPWGSWLRTQRAD